jgi:indole-3-glycerol phosphate synthase
MSDILAKIVDRKILEVKERRELYPVKLLEKSIFFPSRIVSLKKYLSREDKSGIIAEFKRKSPSKGIINEHVSIERTSIGYMQAGASALSVLTDREFFGGSSEDLSNARKFNFCPILRKDFIVDPYQIIEAKSIGADAILLIAAALTPEKTQELARFARQETGMEVLMEVHNQQELSSHLNDYIDIVGVNNRDLKTFEVNINTSIALADAIPDALVKISESGISKPESVLQLKKHGYEGFLIGEYFMSHNLPGAACADFIQRLKYLEQAHDEEHTK